MNKLTGVVAGVVLTPLVTFAHHSFSEFDGGEVRELVGEVVRVQWRNPHVRVSIRVEEDGGTEQVWDMEGQDLNSLDRAGVPRDTIQVGQIIRVAGATSTRREGHLAISNLLLPGGQELLMLRAQGPRWSNVVLGDRGAARGSADEFERPVNDIFRVWTTAESNVPAFSADPPLTSAARQAYEAFDPINDDPVLGCVAPGMPEAMTYIGPHPVGFVRRDDGDIEIHIESDDNVRIVHMAEDASAEGQPPSALGYSVGRWEGDVLLVTTTRINWPYFKALDFVAAPQSEAVEIVERFTLDRDAGELLYGFTARDPATFTEPVSAERYHVWRYRPGISVEPYDCVLD